MAIRVDMIPRAVHDRRRARHRRRIWMLIATVLVSCTGGVGAYASRRAAQVVELRRRGVERRQETVALRRATVQLAQNVADAQRILLEAENLRDGHRWSRIVTFVGREIPDSVLLVAMGTDPTQSGRAVPPRRAGESRGRGARERESNTLTLQGYALGHPDIAGFLQDLPFVLKQG